MGFGYPGGCSDFVHRSVGAAVGDVLTHGPVEQEDVLAHQPDGLSQVVQSEVAYVVAVECSEPPVTS